MWPLMVSLARLVRGGGLGTGGYRGRALIGLMSTFIEPIRCLAFNAARGPGRGGAVSTPPPDGTLAHRIPRVRQVRDTF